MMEGEGQESGELQAWDLELVVWGRHLLVLDQEYQGRLQLQETEREQTATPPQTEHLSQQGKVVQALSMIYMMVTALIVKSNKLHIEYYDHYDC